MKVPEIHGFFGRENELLWLRTLWDEVTRRDKEGRFTGSPRIGILLGESGYGKTRLVQALYQWLASDRYWDPPEWNYWPDDFGNEGDTLRVNPNLEGHEPKGPPRFLWLGVRWHNPGERNVKEGSDLQELLETLDIHRKLVERHQGDWKEIVKKLGGEVVKDLPWEALGTINPLLGLSVKVLKGGIKAIEFVRQIREKQINSFEDLKHQKEEDLTQHLLSTFETIFSLQGGLPTVLFLDDAHWIDPTSMDFLHRLWERARKKRWPLLILITHWHREWLEYRRLPEEEKRKKIVSLKGEDGVKIREIGKVEEGDLFSYLSYKLPGLTKEQRELLVEKADGNFLTLVENVGVLLKSPRFYFEGGNTKGRLSKGGEDTVRTWKSKREERVKERFEELQDDIKEVLAWSSRLGERFLEEVVVAFAGKKGWEREKAEKLLKECEDPYWILGRRSPPVWEFRDRTYHRIAKEFFENLKEDEKGLREVFLQVLGDWVNRSFDENGNPLFSEGEGNPPPNSLSALPQPLRRDVLSRFLEEVSTDGEGLPVLRGRVLYLLDLAIFRDWDRFREYGNFLSEVEWGKVEEKEISRDCRWILAEFSFSAGAYPEARLLLEGLSIRFRKSLETSPTPEVFRDLAGTLNNLGVLAYTQGDLGGARRYWEESLEILRGLVDSLGTPEVFRDLAWTLNNLGLLAQAQGDLGGARRYYEESLEIRRGLVASLGTPEARRDLAITLHNLGLLAQDQGDLGGARRYWEESLEIRRELVASLGTHEVRHHLAMTLPIIVLLAKGQGDLEVAQRYLEESLKILEDFHKTTPTPEVSQLLKELQKFLSKLKENS